MSAPSNAFHSIVHPEVTAWLQALAGEDDPLLARMEAYCAERDFPLIGRSSGRWLEQLTRMIGGKRVFELGSGFGYSAFFFARAVGEGGSVIGTELDAHELVAFERFFAGHELKPRIRIEQGDAIEILNRTEGLFDVVFFDIHKEGYPAALEAAVPRLRPGGLLLADNIIWGGRTARPAEPGDTSTLALQRFARAIHQDPRLQTNVMAVGDGLAVCRRVD